MDLSFARRRKAQLRAATPDLASLLSQVAARQSTTLTARVIAELSNPGRPVESDTRVDLFSAVREGTSHSAITRFSSLTLPVTPRQGS